MDLIASAVNGRCIATVLADGELAVAGSAGQANRQSTATLVGQRLPFRPPTGSIFAAWFTEAEANAWASRSEPGRALEALSVFRRRGYSLGLLNNVQRAFAARLNAIATGQGHPQELEGLMDGLAYDPSELTPEALAAVRLISAPVFDAPGRVALALTLHDFAKPTSDHGIESYIGKLVEAAGRITAHLGGRNLHEPQTQEIP
jgi:DNA-binding IclR family transcriptional regulator